MTPQDKAEELVRETFTIFLGDDGKEEFWTSKLEAQNYAVRCVNEIIEALNYHQWQNRKLILYWEEVKQEIEKL